MHQIIGADGKQYGPISDEQLRQWIAEGRVNAHTQIKLAGATQWQRLDSLPIFSSTVTALGTPPPKNSGLAISSAVLGMLGFCGVTALIGLVLGIIALVQIRASGGRLAGKGFAIAGIVISAVMLLALVGIAFPIYSTAKRKVQIVRCLGNAHQLAFGLTMFSSAHTNHLPAATSWCNDLQSYVDAETFRCGAGDPKKSSHFAFNTNMTGIDSRSLTSPQTTVVIFESDGGWNMSGGPELAKVRHEGKLTVVFADGHAESVTPKRLQTLRWVP
jgi:prepilin-type processing-associated H-X9-DG protein